MATNKPKLTKASVTAALTQAEGVINNAAFILKRCRQTISKYIKKHELEYLLEELVDVNKDKVRSTLLDMALGRLICERILPTGEIVTYSPAPNYQALRTQAEIYGIYAPKLVTDVNVKSFDLDVAGEKMKPFGEKE